VSRFEAQAAAYSAMPQQHIEHLEHTNTRMDIKEVDYAAGSYVSMAKYFIYL